MKLVTPRMARRGEGVGGGGGWEVGKYRRKKNPDASLIKSDDSFQPTVQSNYLFSIMGQETGDLSAGRGVCVCVCGGGGILAGGGGRGCLGGVLSSAFFSREGDSQQAFAGLAEV